MGKWKGSTTVEAAIIMPIFLVMLVTMLMFAMFVYEKAAMRSVCNRVSAEAAAIWERGEDYMISYYANGSAPPAETQEKVHIYQIYANFFSSAINLGHQSKSDIVSAQLAKEIARHSFLLTESDVVVKAAATNVFIHKSLTVQAEATYDLPFYTNTSKVSAESVIQGQTELIRTVDLAADLLLDGPLSGLKNSYSGMIEKLKQLLGKVKYTPEQQG